MGGVSNEGLMDTLLGLSLPAASKDYLNFFEMGGVLRDNDKAVSKIDVKTKLLVRHRLRYVYLTNSIG